MIIVLCGYMGCGKSLIGSRLASHLQLSFLDLDDAIEQHEEGTISSLFSDKGEIKFRKIEAEVLQSTLQTQKNCVLALGGGTPCYGQNLKLIKDHPDTRLVYLKMSLEALTERLFPETEKRPLLKNITQKEELKDFIRKHLFERRFYYMQADFKIDCSGESLEETVTKIGERLEENKGEQA